MSIRQYNVIVYKESGDNTEGGMMSCSAEKSTSNKFVIVNAELGDVFCSCQEKVLFVGDEIAFPLQSDIEASARMNKV